MVELMDAGPLEDLSAATELLEPLLDGIATDLWEAQDIRCETFVGPLYTPEHGPNRIAS